MEGKYPMKRCSKHSECGNYTGMLLRCCECSAMYNRIVGRHTQHYAVHHVIVIEDQVEPIVLYFQMLHSVIEFTIPADAYFTI